MAEAGSGSTLWNTSIAIDNEPDNDGDYTLVGYDANGVNVFDPDW